MTQAIQTFVDKVCIPCANWEISTNDMRAEFKSWCRETGHNPRGSHKLLNRALHKNFRLVRPNLFHALWVGVRIDWSYLDKE